MLSLQTRQAHHAVAGSLRSIVPLRLHAQDLPLGLAEATLARLLDRLAGQGAERRTPPTLAQEIAVFTRPLAFVGRAGIVHRARHARDVTAVEPRRLRR